MTVRRVLVELHRAPRHAGAALRLPAPEIPGGAALPTGVPVAEPQQDRVVGAPELLSDELVESEITAIESGVVEEEVGVVPACERRPGRELEQLVPEPSSELHDDRRASQGAAW